MDEGDVMHRKMDQQCKEEQEGLGCNKQSNDQGEVLKQELVKKDTKGLAVKRQQGRQGESACWLQQGN